MAKLIVNPTSSSRREIALARQLVSIGRDPSNDVVLPDAMVSRRHAVIEFRGSQYFIRDCNSSNGSLVNGDRVSERNLRDGDLVAIGTARMLFKEELEVEDAAGKVVQHPSAPRLHCPSCQADYRKGDQFCRQCGAGVAPPPPSKAVCAACGTVVPLPAKFCNACGQVLPEGSAGAPEPPAKGEERAIARPAADEEKPALAPPVVAPPPAIDDASATPQHVAARTPEPPSPSTHPSGASVRAAAASAVALAAPPPPRRESSPAPRPGARPLSPPPAARAAARQPAAVSRPSTVSMAGVAGMDAPFAPRLVAGLVDAAIVGSVQSLLLWPVLGYWWSRDLRGEVPFLPILLSLLAVPLILALGGAYFAWFWGVKGATPGKKMLRLAVATETGAIPVGLQKATLRVLGYAASGLLLGIGFLMIAFGGTALHDRMAGTRVVYRGRG